MATKTSQNAEKITRVWVLGAGASIDGAKKANRAAPSDFDFLKSVSDYFGDSRVKRINAVLWNRVEKGFSITQSKWAEGGLEEGIRKRISRFEANRLFDRARNSGNGKPTITNDDFLADLNELIRWWLGGLKANANGSIKDLVDTVVSSGGKEKIVTFNYDTLVEDCLAKIGISESDAIDLKNLQRSRAANSFTPLLLKMHGSVSWVCLIWPRKAMRIPSTSRL